MRILTTNLFQLFHDSTKKCPDHVALIIKNEKYTYDTLKKKVQALSNRLVQNDLKLNARVIIQAGNSIDTVITFWACLQAGAIPVIISSELSVDKTRAIIADASASHYIGVFSMHQLQNHNLIYFSSDHQNSGTCEVWKKRLDIDLASIIYTSGSTGEPKGVMLSHHNMLAATDSLVTYLGYEQNDIIISALPLAFDYGLYQMIMALSVGATLILELNLNLPHYYLKRIEKYKATIVPVVPSMIPLFTTVLKKLSIDLDSVRLLTNTGAALRENHIAHIQTMFRFARIYSMYGLTECKRVSYLPPDNLPKKPSSVGIAIPNTEIWIVDEEGALLPPNQIGQLVVRGSTVMQGYWNKPHETTQKIKIGKIPSERILYTGDYCYLDEEGYLYFCGRMDEMLKCRGVKVSAKEIEDIVSTLDQVSEVAIIGIDNILYGTEICACITLVENASITREIIRAFCQQHLEKEKIPSQFHLLAFLPKTSNGKIDKFALEMLINDNRMAS